MWHFWLTIFDSTLKFNQDILRTHASQGQLILKYNMKKDVAIYKLTTLNLQPFKMYCIKLLLQCHLITNFASKPFLPVAKPTGLAELNVLSSSFFLSFRHLVWRDQNSPNKHGSICSVGHKFQIWFYIWPPRLFGGHTGLKTSSFENFCLQSVVSSSVVTI